MEPAQLVSLGMRALLGTFFLFSGFHKLFNTGRRQTLKQTFIDDGCYNPAMMWVVPLGEFFGGLALLVGFLVVPAALGLAVLCAGACLLDGVKRVRAWKPIDFADEVDDYLYLPEVLYIVMLVMLVILGPSPLAIDRVLDLPI